MNITVEHTAKNLNVQNHIYHGINNKNCFLNFLKRFVANAQHSQSEIEFRCKNEYINWLYTGFYTQFRTSGSLQKPSRDIDIPAGPIGLLNNVLIQPHFDYSSLVWTNCTQVLHNKLQKLQNCA